MNKEKATQILDLTKVILRAQAELQKLGVTFTISQSLSDAVSFAQGYLLAKNESTEVENVEAAK